MFRVGRRRWSSVNGGFDNANSFGNLPLQEVEVQAVRGCDLTMHEHSPNMIRDRDHGS